jgi:hypothetical protein
MLSLPVLELLQDSHDPPITPEVLREIESALEASLPKDYAEFLGQFNGGRFTRNVEFAIPNPTEFVSGDLLMSFIGEPRDGFEHDGLLWHVKDLSDRIPKGFIPIARCNGQDLVLLQLAAENSAPAGVWYWDSAAFWISDEENSMYFLADTFSVFLSMLSCDICEEMEELEQLPVFHAVEWGNRRAIEHYLAVGGDANARNEKGQTLLSASAIYQWPKIVQLLLEHSANPNARDHQGRTPLHHAAMHSIDSVKLLLAAGADVKARDQHGKSVLGQWSYRADQILRAHGAED